jgi:hypothetical protein
MYTKRKNATRFITINNDNWVPALPFMTVAFNFLKCFKLKYKDLLA